MEGIDTKNIIIRAAVNFKREIFIELNLVRPKILNYMGIRNYERLLKIKLLNNHEMPFRHYMIRHRCDR
jgi:hypothetical protein